MPFTDDELKFHSNFALNLSRFFNSQIRRRRRGAIIIIFRQYIFAAPHCFYEQPAESGY